MKRKTILVLLMFAVLGVAGCNSAASDIHKDRIDESRQSVPEADQDVTVKSKEIAESYRDIYEQAINDNTLGTLETISNIVKRIGSIGYVVVDADNQIDMINEAKLMGFIEDVNGKNAAELTLIRVVMNGGFIRYDFQTSEGNVHITRSYLTWSQKIPEISWKEEYDAYTWKYSEDGYLFFEEYHMPGYDGPSGHTAVRVQPLDKKCRELNRQFILPVNYELNNMFTVNWSEDDFGELEFYDLFDLFYSNVLKNEFPYVADDNLGIGAIYNISKEEFEKVIMPFFNIDSLTLQEEARYSAENQSYEYRPRGLYDCEPPSYPFPEVVNYTENEDGTITLTIYAVYPDHNISKAYAHEVVIRPLDNGKYQYVSNYIIPDESNDIGSWRVDRLTDEAWEDAYGTK